MKLPEDWSEQNAEVASFRYVNPSKPEEEFYFKILKAGDSKLEVNALSSARNDEIASCEIE